MAAPSPLVSVAWLSEHLADPDLRLIHVAPSRRVYNRRYLSGAVYGDLHRELALRGRAPETRASPATLAERVATDSARPWRGEEPAAWLAARVAERETLDRDVAEVIVDVDALLPGEVVNRIVDALATALDAHRPG